MESEQKFGLGVGALLVVAVMSICGAGKGCNDSDNAAITNAVNKGCSKYSNGVIVCPPKAN